MSKAYAETWLDVGRLPLRRRDRAAMVLARSWLSRREWSLALARDALSSGGVVALEILDAVHDSSVRARLLRARLALLLRVLLRVDAGDYGKATSIPAGPWCRRADHRRDDAGRCRVITCGCWRWVVLPPLWEATR